ncbi:MAG: hypothetical protein WAO14_09820, partial [Pseudolabrys sp.]
MSPNRRVTITLMRARFWMRRVCRQGTSIWWPARSHTASSKVPPKPGYGPWELSADRANAVRQILDAEGVPSGNIYMV